MPRTVSVAGRRGVVAAVSLALLLLTIMLFVDKTVVDDAYISLRASLHLIRGDGLVFNRTEHVEAFSNLLWTLTMAVPIAMGVGPTAAAGYGGLAMAVIALCRAVMTARDLSGTWLPTAFVVVVTPAFWSMAALGLEGGLYAWLLVELLGATIRRSGPQVALVGALLFMTRVESALLLAPVVLVWAFDRNTPARTRLRYATQAAVGWIGAAFLVTGWRYAYYGAVLPNSVRAKSGDLLDLQMLRNNLIDGWSYLLDALPVVAGVLVATGVGLAGPVRRSAACALMAFGVASVVALRNGGDWMSHSRLLTPYVPMLAVPAGSTLAWLWQGTRSRVRASPSNSRAVAIGVSAVMSMLVGWGLTAYRWSEPSARLGTPYPQNLDMARAIRDDLTTSDIVAVEALGYFSYFAPDAYVHDFLGLAEPHISRYGQLVPPWGKVDYRYTIDDVRPNLIMLHSGYWHFRKMMNASARPLLTDYEFYAICPVADLSGSFFFVAIATRDVPRLSKPLLDVGLCPIPEP